MLEQGALDEVRAFARLGQARRRKSLARLNFVAILPARSASPEAAAAAVTATRQFAKRQRTWFRSKMDGLGAGGFADGAGYRGPVMTAIPAYGERMESIWNPYGSDGPSGSASYWLRSRSVQRTSRS